MRRAWIGTLLALTLPTVHAEPCGSETLQLQILGSGAGELGEGRAAPAVLVWIDGKPRVLVDIGPGAAMRFVRAGANIAELDAILLTHLHANRTADLPALVQLTATPARVRPLPVYGPNGNRWTPSTVSFVRSLFDPTRGAWRHLGNLLSPLVRSSYKLEPHDLRPPPGKLGVTRENREQLIPVLTNDHVRIAALPLNYGQTAALAWRIESRGKRIVMSPNINVNHDALERFAEDADMLVTSSATLESATPGKVEMLTATAIGRLASAIHAKTVVLVARAHDTLGQEDESVALMRGLYEGAIVYADDLDCLTP